MRRFLVDVLVVGTMACGGGGNGPTDPPNPPPPPPTVAVATVEVSPPNGSALTGATLQLAATLRDARGGILTGRTVTWAASPADRATVSSTGLVSALTPGVVTVTAAAEGRSGSAAITIIDARNIPFFDRPFDGQFPVVNLLDHDVPQQFRDTSGRFTTFWGEVHPELGGFTDGHSGYDFMTPTGTPMLAVAAGTVVRLERTQTPFFCPILNRNVSDQQSVWLEHLLPGGLRLQSWYVHLGRIDVTVGQTVSAGQVVGLSGNSGCAIFPALHFEVYRVSETRLTTIDPYGWTGPFSDPWASHAEGGPSIQLWKPGQAPLLWREVTYNPGGVAPFAPLVLTRVVFQGVNDAENPNNEYVELTLDTRLASSLSLDGYGIRPQDQPGLDYRFPAGRTLTAAQPTIRVYTGPGANSASAVYMGRSSGIWSNNALRVCARVLYPGNTSSGVYFAC